MTIHQQHRAIARRATRLFLYNMGALEWAALVWGYVAVLEPHRMVFQRHWRQTWGGG